MTHHVRASAQPSVCDDVRPAVAPRGAVTGVAAETESERETPGEPVKRRALLFISQCVYLAKAMLFLSRKDVFISQLLFISRISRWLEVERC